MLTRSALSKKLSTLAHVQYLFLHKGTTEHRIEHFRTWTTEAQAVAAAVLLLYFFFKFTVDIHTNIYTTKISSIYAYIRINVHTCMYIYTYKCTYIHIHIYI
jgi:hypothetical protein